MLVPASIGSGDSFYVSATFEIDSLSLRDALPISEVSGSNTPEVVLAVLEMFVVREESTLTTRVTDLLAPDVDGESTHLTSATRSARMPSSARKIVPAGIASDRLTPVASDGPLFVTVSV